MAATFTPFRPPYSSIEKIKRSLAVLQSSIRASVKLLRQGSGFAASLEITDRCNAGCHYCYVYSPEWEQKQRMQGYLQLHPQEHREKEQELFGILQQLKERGVVHLTLVGGEPALAPDLVSYAARRFPIVWLVTNGAAKLPPLPHSTTVFVSMDGPPDYHNQSRDPGGYFAKHRYNHLEGMSAAIVRNLNESDRGAFVHLTLTPSVLPRFEETIDWLVQDVKKLRGIVVSGTTVNSLADPLAFSQENRQTLKQLITKKAEQYGWQLFPFNSPKVNQFLFDPGHIIKRASDCAIARRIESLGFDGKSVGKCILRDEANCQTCVCNMTGLQRAIESFDIPTILGITPTLFG